MTEILLVAGITLLVSFLCSLFESSLYALSPSQAETLAASGRFGTRRLQLLRDHVDEPIAAILSINTIANTAGAAWFGSLVAAHYGDGSNALALGTALLTFAILLVAEIIPKSLGVRYAKQFGPLIAWPLQFMVWLVWPVVKASALLMRLLTRGGEPEAPSEAEVEVLAREAAQQGSMRAQEYRWVRNALALDRVMARDVMTPRTVVASLPADTRICDIDPADHPWKYSRVPITKGPNLDGLIGIAYQKQVFEEVLAGRNETAMRDIARPIDIVPETMLGHDLLSKLLRDRVHMVAVADEFGGIEGIVTLEDVLESLLGSEIVDEHDEVTDMQQLARDLAARPDGQAPGVEDA
jgi:CBS domain containing-hemolysin-like protein